jgi:hypothetical protein
VTFHRTLLSLNMPLKQGLMLTRTVQANPLHMFGKASSCDNLLLDQDNT